MPKRPLDVTPALDDRHKQVIHDGKKAAYAKTELFDLEADPKRKTTSPTNNRIESNSSKSSSAHGSHPF